MFTSQIAFDKIIIKKVFLLCISYLFTAKQHKNDVSTQIQWTCATYIEIVKLRVV